MREMEIFATVARRAANGPGDGDCEATGLGSPNVALRASSNPFHVRVKSGRSSSSASSARLGLYWAVVPEGSQIAQQAALRSMEEGRKVAGHPDAEVSRDPLDLN